MKRQVWLTGVVCSAALQLACETSSDTDLSPATAGAGSAPFDGGSGTRVSEPGRYSGYSRPISTGYLQSSQYVTTRDGTKLAMDLYRPKDDAGSAIQKPLPVLWMHTPYNRRTYLGGLSAETYPGYALRLVEYGYVIAVVDFRGLYASYGTNVADTRGEWADAARYDAYDVTEWLATQSWSNGRIGMWGCSGSGASQLQAASTKPPHLLAIFPMSCEFDAYSFAVPGGVAPPEGMPTRLAPEASAPAQRDSTAMPVDGDNGVSMLAEASAQHAKNVDNPGYVPFRDSTATGIAEPWWVKSSPYNYLDALQTSSVAVYLAANWDEATTKAGALLMYNNLKNRMKLLIGPGKHCDWATVKTDTGFDIALEELRFFDYWLKDVDNSISAEPGVHFYTYNAAPGTEWQSSVRWPLQQEQRTRYYLGERVLNTSMVGEGKDQIAVDYDVTPATRLLKGLVYESEPLPSDLQVTGHPIAELWVSSTTTDGDFITTIEDVGPDGTSNSYNMTGRLRASHRKVTQAPYNNLGLPWHRSFKEDAAPLVPGEPAQLIFELLPISIIFKAGHQIRVVLTFSAGAATPRVTPPPMVTIHRENARRSSIVLPTLAIHSGR